MRRFFFIKLIFIIIFQFILFDTVYSDNKLSYTYSYHSINFVSIGQVNALEFCVPIAQVNSPPGQLANIFDKAGGSLSYVNNNKTMLFYLADGIESVQFMVTLKNGKVLSLHFIGDKLMGRVVRVPEEMSGKDTQRRKGIHQSYDAKIEKIMRAAFINDDMGRGWEKLKESKPMHYHEIRINQYTEWDNIFYKIGRWDFCSKSKSALMISYDKSVHGSKVLAATLSHRKLLPQDCARLILLYAKDDGHVV